MDYTLSIHPTHARKAMGMKVLAGYEKSGVVRDAFLALGHDAMSCDLEPSDSAGPHYQGNIFDVIDYPWDLAIFHPPCTNTSVSGARWFKEKRMDGRQQAGVALFMQTVRRSAHIPKVCIEHPVSIMSSLYRKPDQIIQPYEYWDGEFGMGEVKTTCLWLRGLPFLIATTPNEPGRHQACWLAPPSETRAADRAKTYTGIAKAMAEQWA